MVMMTANVTDHDLGISKDPFGIEPGRFNHVAFAYDTRGEIMRLADICYEYGHEMEFGPSRHGGSELYFFYVLEPGGNRVELCSGGYLFFEPDRPIFEHWVSEGGVGDVGQRVSSRHVRARDPAGGSQDGEGGGGVHHGGVT